jgi:hypothetical protein
MRSTVPVACVLLASCILISCGRQDASTPGQNRAEAPTKTLDALGQKLIQYNGLYPNDPLGSHAILDIVEVRAGVQSSVPDAALIERLYNRDASQIPITRAGQDMIVAACEDNNCAEHNWTVQINIETRAVIVCYFNSKNQTAGQAKSAWFTGGGKREDRTGPCFADGSQPVLT